MAFEKIVETRRSGTLSSGRTKVPLGCLTEAARSTDAGAPVEQQKNQLLLGLALKPKFTLVGPLFLESTLKSRRQEPSLCTRKKRLESKDPTPSK